MNKNYYVNQAKKLAKAKKKANTSESNLRDMFLKTYFSDDEGKFQYHGLYEECTKYGAEFFKIDEMPGWAFLCSDYEESGGHYSYHVLGYIHEEGQEVGKFQQRPDIDIELHWD